jgi:hypothetical protein
MDIPNSITTFYSDWNFIALTLTTEQQNYYWDMVLTKNLNNIDTLSKNDVLILRSLINVYKNYYKGQKTSPIGNRVINIVDSKMKNDQSIQITYEIRNINKKINKNNKLSQEQMSK